MGPDDDRHIAILEIPDTFVESSLDWLIKRLEKIEDEALKDANALLAKVGAGLAGSLALLGAMVAARDVLFWRVCSGNYIFIPFIMAELLAIVSAFYHFHEAYSPIDMFISPSYRDGARLGRIIDTDSIDLKFSHAKDLQSNIRHNKGLIDERNRHVEIGFRDLFIALVSIALHVALGGIIRFVS